MGERKHTKTCKNGGLGVEETCVVGLVEAGAARVAETCVVGMVEKGAASVGGMRAIGIAVSAVVLGSSGISVIRRMNS